MSEKNLNVPKLDILKEQIIKSWDKNVIIRASDLEDATDKSYHNLIMPWVVEKVTSNTAAQNSIVDIGCGCGYLTNAIYQTGRNKIIGVDISSASITYAKEKYPHIQFRCEDICGLKEIHEFDLCLAVMVLNNMPNIYAFFEGVRNLLTDEGSLILVIPHPCFWPGQHLKNNEFDYSKEREYEFTFATQGRKDYSSTVFYFHRMLETYFRCIEQNGFFMKDFHEIAEADNKRNPDILCMELGLSLSKKKTT